MKTYKSMPLIDNRELPVVPNYVDLFFRRLKAKGEDGLADMYLDLHTQLEILAKQRDRTEYTSLDRWSKLDERVAILRHRLRYFEVYANE